MAVVALLVGGATACTKVQARTPPPAGPALDTPAPPQRLIIPVHVSEPEPTPAPAVTTPPAATPPRPQPPSRPPERTAPQPAQTTETPPPAAQPVLQNTPNVDQAEQRASGMLSDAERDLNHVDPRSLSTNMRDQYDQARRFVQLARNALKTQNVVYASELARKAAALASQLVRR